MREEGADEILDIATLTGAAKQTVGNRSAVVQSNNNALYETAQKQS
ncbi:MAG: leucyl aminopeptidase family protein [Lactobacillales bacterium]|nr:leucyl aminopeptidase family protein [Lactobacillales bacterium]